MPDLIADAAEWLADELAANLATTVTYRRGSDSVSVSATKGRTQFELENDDGRVTHWEARDWLIDPAALTFGAGTIEPAAGDQIEETAGSTTYTYEITGPPGADVWRWTGPHRQQRRIHSQLVDET